MREFDDVDAKIKRIIAEEMGYELSEITDDKILDVDLGIDSLDIVELVIVIEDEFNISIDDSQIETFTTVRSLIDFVKLGRFK